MNTTLKEIMDKNTLMTLCTVDEQGFPKGRSVDYAMGEDEKTVYMITMKNTDKVKEIANNNNVFVVIDYDVEGMEELSKVQYVKAKGKAYLAENDEETMIAFGKIVAKYPYLQGLPGEPSDFVGVRIELSEASITDNTVHFGYTEKIKL